MALWQETDEKRSWRLSLGAYYYTVTIVPFVFAPADHGQYLLPVMRVDLSSSRWRPFTELYTVVPPITRLIRLGGDLAIQIPRYQMHYGYVKAVMRPTKESPRCRVISVIKELVIRCFVVLFNRQKLADFGMIQIFKQKWQGRPGMKWGHAFLHLRSTYSLHVHFTPRDPVNHDENKWQNPLQILKSTKL